MKESASMATPPHLPDANAYDPNVTAPPRSVDTGNKSRHVAQLSNVPVLGRTTLMSRFQQAASGNAARGSNFPRLIAFLQPWKWIWPYVKDFFHKNAPYQSYDEPATGIFRIETPSDGPLRVALAADWGTGTLESETVAENMKEWDSHLTLHLGDVYYMGEGCEIEENCLGIETKEHDGVCWPTGKLGSFALMGNHEMYSGGQGYFEEFLPKLGLWATDKEPLQEQKASYFCVVTDHWIILGLDTGYHSGGFPALGDVPWLRSRPSLNVDARFDDTMMAWLTATMAKLQGESAERSVLVLSHHQPVSSFEGAYLKPAQQLADAGVLNGREFVWLYGHEHRLTLYNKQTIAKSLTAYPRCVGHGGMPVDVSDPAKVKPSVQFYDPRTHAIDVDHPETKVGVNGHLRLTFDGPELSIEYRDIDYHQVEGSASLMTETFGPDTGGKLVYRHTEPEAGTLVPGPAPAR